MARLIDADALKTCIKEEIDNIGDADIDDAYYSGEKSALNAVMCMISATPTFNAELVRRGKWLTHPTEKDYDVCPVCGTGTRKRRHGFENGLGWYEEEVYQFCPHCGARMEG